MFNRKNRVLKMNGIKYRVEKGDIQEKDGLFLFSNRLYTVDNNCIYNRFGKKESVFEFKDVLNVTNCEKINILDCYIGQQIYLPFTICKNELFLSSGFYTVCRLNIEHPSPTERSSLLFIVKKDGILKQVTNEILKINFYIFK